jgi:NAD(P)H-hydrate epimerase
MNRRSAILTVRQMGEADRLTIAAGTSGQALMENAGAAVAHAILARHRPGPVTILCGPEAGWPVRLALLGARDHLKGEARYHAAQWRGDVSPLAPAALDGAALIVDAIFGAGLSRALSGPAAETLAAAAQTGAPIVAIDIPSGIMGDTGESLGAVAAALTVTYFRKTPGHLLLPGRPLCGEIVVANIGTPDSVLDTISPNTFENAPSLWLPQFPQRTDAGNKYTSGHALISGGYPMTGAARMSARAAARAGAGLTTIAVPQAALPVYATALTSIMVHPLAAPADLAYLLADHRVTAFLLGPGAGISEETRSRALAMLATTRATLLDADAITSFQANPAALFSAISGPCVMTPHEGEFKRVFDPKGDKLLRTRAAARLSGAVIVLKGADTVIAAPDGNAIINANAPPTLATAGAGDVLSGIILGLLAQNMPPFLAAAAGVWLHGAAAAAFGPGLLAEDLPDLLPGVLRELIHRHGG